jgi:hypothetical protein
VDFAPAAPYNAAFALFTRWLARQAPFASSIAIVARILKQPMRTWN